MFAFERAIALLSLSGHNPSRGRRRKLIVSFYNYHGPMPCLLSSGLCNRRFHCPITSPAHLGGGENFPSYIITVNAVLALQRVVTICHCPVTTHLWRRRRSYCFFSLFLPPYNQCPASQELSPLFPVRSWLTSDTTIRKTLSVLLHRQQRHRFPGLLQYHQARGPR